jgi:uncharacterized surface protein with fasciclin (FAS1) repeats
MFRDRFIGAACAIALGLAAGALADISIYDVLQSNGVIHSVDRVLMPK